MAVTIPQLKDIKDQASQVICEEVNAANASMPPEIARGSGPLGQERGPVVRIRFPPAWSLLRT